MADRLISVGDDFKLPDAVKVSDANLPSGSKASDIASKVDLTQKGAANGVATLDADAKIPTSQLPPLAIGDTMPVASQSEMLALTAQRGDIAIRSDINKTFILASNSPSVLADWKEIMASGQVQSVAGKTGVVALVKADVGLSNVDNTADSAKPVATGSANGLMSSADKTKLDGATSSAANNSVMSRDAAGRTNVQSIGVSLSPTNANDATRKDYVDASLALKLDVSANKAQSITSRPATDAPSTYPLGFSYMGVSDVTWPVSMVTVFTTRSFAGRTMQLAVSKVDGTMWVRSEMDGDVWVAFSKLSTSTYVDAQVATRAATTHSHPLSDITITALGAAQDLDTYLTTGMYHQSLNANATLPLNYPEAAAGLLEVYTIDTFVYQRYLVYASNGADVYWRAKYAANAWTAWQRAANDNPASGSANGLMSSTDKAKLDAASSVETASALVQRDSSGNAQFGTVVANDAPTAINHVTRKDYVDTALALKAPLASPAFTGTPTGITKTHVGLSNVDNTADTAKPVSTAQQTALNAKAPLASPAFTGTPTGITKAHVGLGSVDNTADIDKAFLRGDDGVKYRIVAGVIRNVGSPTYWEFINDPGHVPIGVSSITSDATQITINYNFTATKAGTFIITTDETMALLKYTCGASVGVSSAVIKLSRNRTINSYVYYDGAAWQSSSSDFVVSSFSAGTLALTHENMLGTAVSVSGRGGAALPAVSDGGGAITGTATLIKFYDTAGTLLTTPTTNMKVYVSRTDAVGTANPQTIIDTTIAPLHNLWFYGVFPI